MKYLKLFNEATFYGRYEGESDSNILDGLEDILTELEDEGIEVRIWRNLHRNRNYKIKEGKLNNVEIEIIWKKHIQYPSQKKLLGYTEPILVSKRREMIDKYMNRNDFELIDTVIRKNVITSYDQHNVSIFLHYKKNT
jgi:hypothetical protein